MKFKIKENGDYNIWQRNKIVGYIREQAKDFWLYEQRDENTIDELIEIKEFMEKLSNK